MHINSNVQNLQLTVEKICSQPDGAQMLPIPSLLNVDRLEYIVYDILTIQQMVYARYIFFVSKNLLKYSVHVHVYKTSTNNGQLTADMAFV